VFSFAFFLFVIIPELSVASLNVLFVDSVVTECTKWIHPEHVSF